MQMVVTRVMVKVHQHRLAIVIVAHLIQILVGNLDQFLFGVFITLARDSCMKLRHTSAVIPGRVVH